MTDPIRVVIFDVGGVLVRTEDQHASRLALEARLGLPPGGSEQLVFNGPMGLAAQRGEITTAALWAWIAAELQLDEAGLRRFHEAFWAGDRLDNGLVDFVRSLRPAYRTAIISNWRDDLRQALTEAFPMADAFDLIVCSAEEKIMKPDAAIFERALARLGCRAEETVFIDDFRHNVEAARGVGMQAIHFYPGLDLPGALAELGIEPDPAS